MRVATPGGLLCFVSELNPFGFPGFRQLIQVRSTARYRAPDENRNDDYDSHCNEELPSVLFDYAPGVFAEADGQPSFDEKSNARGQ